MLPPSARLLVCSQHSSQQHTNANNQPCDTFKHTLLFNFPTNCTFTPRTVFVPPRAVLCHNAMQQQQQQQQLQQKQQPHNATRSGTCSALLCSVCSAVPVSVSLRLRSLPTARPRATQPHSQRRNANNCKAHFLLYWNHCKQQPSDVRCPNGAHDMYTY